MTIRYCLLAVFAVAVVVAAVPNASAQCGAVMPPLQHHNGAAQSVCACFVQGEEAGAVFTAPAGDYPIEITEVRITWASQFGGAPQTLEQAIHVYAGGLPNPGAPVYSLPGPVLTDGANNAFVLPNPPTVNSGPVTVTLEFQNTNANNVFAPSVVWDSDGCQPGVNVVKAIPGGWSDACQLGVAGDWLVEVLYRPCNVVATDVKSMSMVKSFYDQ